MDCYEFCLWLQGHIDIGRPTYLDAKSIAIVTEKLREALTEGQFVIIRREDSVTITDDLN